MLERDLALGAAPDNMYEISFAAMWALVVPLSWGRGPRGESAFERRVGARLRASSALEAA